ncbi:MAG: signal peptidase II [Christensenellales bacterium]
MRRWYTAIIIFVIAIDRLVKLWTVKTLALYETLPIWEGVFHFTYVENKGAAFGMLQGQFLFFFIITAVLTLALVWILYFRLPKIKGCGVGLAMLLGGALGNFYDRAVYGFVVDTFDFRLINFAVFNVADSAICVGAAVFLLFYIISDFKAAKQAKADALKTREANPEAAEK